MERDKRIDTLKGVLIILVVFGHCFKYGEPTDNIKIVASNWIYLFHMPFFVFLSGYFTHPQNRTFWKGMLGIIESYIVFQLIKGVLSGYSVTELLLTPAPMMWYLLALIIWRSFHFVIDKMKHSKVINMWILPVLVVLGLLAGFNDSIGRTFSFSRIISFAPFFWVGIMLQGKDFVGFCKRIPLWISLLIIILTIAVVIVLSPIEIINLREIVRCASCYNPGNQMIGFYGRALYYVVAVLLSMAIARLTIESELLNQIGQDTMKFYLFHSVALPFMVYMNLPWNWWFSILYGVGLVLVIYIFNLSKLSDFAIRPIYYITSFIKQKKSDNNERTS